MAAITIIIIFHAYIKLNVLNKKVDSINFCCIFKLNKNSVIIEAKNNIKKFQRLMFIKINSLDANLVI